MKKEKEPDMIKPPFEAICIDDANRPPEIPVEKWVVKGRRYTVSKVMKSKSDGGYGFVIDELGLDDSNYPYNSIAIRRFGIPMDQLTSEEEKEAEEAVKKLTEEVTQPV